MTSGLNLQIEASQEMTEINLGGSHLSYSRYPLDTTTGLSR